MKRWVHPFLFTTLIGALLLGTSAPAEAEGTTVAVLDLAFEGEIPPWMSARLRLRLEQGLAATGLSMMSGERINEALSGSGGSCATATCRKALGQKLGCDYLVGGTIQGEARSFVFQLWIARSGTGDIISTLKEGCDICGQRKVFSRMELVASRLSARMAGETNAPARILLDSDPAGAQITVGNTPMGTTPRALSLPPGSHRITLKAPGHIPAVLDVEAISGMEERRTVDLIPTDMSAGERRAGWIAMGTGVAALAAGVALLVMDGGSAGCTGNEPTIGDTSGPCPQRYETALAGGMLAGLGSAALAGGAALLYLGYRGDEPAKEKASLRLSLAGISGRFW